MKNFTKFLSILFAAVIILSGCSSNNAADSQDRSADEKLALSYVTDYYNGTKKEDRLKFVDENVHPDVQGRLRVWAKSGALEDQKLKDPKVAESVPYEDEDLKGTLVLIQSANDKEIIVMINDNKVYMGLAPSGNAEDSFQDIRSSFKTAK
ncbi:hypothetical protein MH117_15250 [Paenibacillus sp. ACRRX]|uniref:hypothetical protein n=1 Tax=unclassified Paenibacillus TaxID=185978 RepID=UPI001EF3E21A|nr:MULTISPECIES: hypothetical protein [unclassified Paenibacillus]MCG7408787.1 hypothetical protein [Paenibacillus sp. ACRRX]MDK8183557.1 hypothetical protein [Paenibacillus sp. UMB4589-SE434]